MKLVVAASVLASAAIACSSSSDDGTSDTGASTEQLQKQANGQPSGDGKTCSWAGTAQYTAAYGNAAPDALRSYNVGDSFKSLDQCNTCTCTAEGIACTVEACAAADAGPVACPAIARVCAGGAPPTQGPNCEQTCPEDTTDCNALMVSAKAEIDTALAADVACTTDDDCVSATYATSCSTGCLAVVSKSGQAAYNATRTDVEANQCAKFKAGSCVFAAVACSDIGVIPKCTNNKCQGAVE